MQLRCLLVFDVGNAPDGTVLRSSVVQEDVELRGADSEGAGEGKVNGFEGCARVLSGGKIPKLSVRRRAVAC